MTEAEDDGSASGASGRGDWSSPSERELLDRSMRDFAEGATALTAASIRLQMMMLEQMSEMLGDLSAMAETAMRDGSKDD